MSELKPLPCPFCGHAELDFEDGSTYRWGVASCGGCGASTGEVRRNYPDDGKWHAEAIKEWNRRAQPAQAGQVLTRHEQEYLYRETSNRVAQLEAENRYEFASWFFIAVELVEQAVLAKLGAGVPMTDPQLQTSEERRATGDRILELIEKQHPGIVGEKGGA